MSNLFMDEIIACLKDKDVKNNIKEIIKPLLEIIVIELYPYIFYFILLLFFHIVITMYIVHIIFKKIEN